MELIPNFKERDQPKGIVKFCNDYYISCFYSRSYNIPCDFLSAYGGTHFCTKVLSLLGLSCTWPFNPFNIDIPTTPTPQK